MNPDDHQLRAREPEPGSENGNSGQSEGDTTPERTECPQTHPYAGGTEHTSSAAGAIPGAFCAATESGSGESDCESAGSEQDREENSHLKRLSNNQKAFLYYYARCGTVTHAAQAAGVVRRQHYEWLKNPDYLTAFESAHEEACDTLEQEARRRATVGWDEPVFHNGMECGLKRKFSDALLIFLMKGAMPAKYRENVVVQGGGTGGVMTVRIVEDENWYANEAHAKQAGRNSGLPSEAVESSTADPSE